MPVSFGYFKTRAPRVAEGNANTTKAPLSSGIPSFLNAINIKYTAALSSAEITITDKKI